MSNVLAFPAQPHRDSAAVVNARETLLRLQTAIALALATLNSEEVFGTQTVLEGVDDIFAALAAWCT